MVKVPLEAVANMNAEVGGNLLGIAKSLSSNVQAREFRAKVILPAKTDGFLVAAKDGSGLLGTIMRGGEMQGQARIIPLSPNSSEAISESLDAGKAGLSASTLVPLIIIGVALVGIEMQLVQIRRGQSAILKYLKDDKRASLEGDISFLLEVADNCALNWSDQNYKAMTAHRAQQIRIESHKFLKGYKKQIDDVIEDESHKPYTSSSVNKAIRNSQELFECYQYSIYLYALSYYMEVVLSGVQSSAYLKDIADKIESESIEYRERYSARYNQIESLISNAADVKASDNMATLMKGAGEIIAKIPVISKGQLDEGLIETGSRMKKGNADKPAKALKGFTKYRSADVTLFTDNLKQLDIIYNEPVEILLDADSLCIRPIA